jgi:hypothetical protein
LIEADRDPITAFILGTYEILALNIARDFSVVCGFKLTFAHRITQIVSKACVRVDLIFKCLVSKDVFVLERAFNVLH